MKYFFIIVLFFSTAMAGCKSTIEPTNLPPTAYQRAVGPFYPSFAGKDSSMDACLSITREYSDQQPDSTYWTATAAFNNGDYTSTIGLVSMGGQALPWYSANDYYKLSFPKVDSTVWSVIDYNTMNFSEHVTMPAKMNCLNHTLWDTVSKSSGFMIKYSGAAGATLTVSGIFLSSNSPLKDSIGFIEFSVHSDSGSVDITPDMLKAIPVGSKVDIELWHDLFYSKVISQNTISHKIGIYTQTENDFFFMLGK